MAQYALHMCFLQRAAHEGIDTAYGMFRKKSGSVQNANMQHKLNESIFPILRNDDKNPRPR